MPFLAGYLDTVVDPNTRIQTSPEYPNTVRCPTRSSDFTQSLPEYNTSPEYPNTVYCPITRIQPIARIQPIPMACYTLSVHLGSLFASSRSTITIPI